MSDDSLNSKRSVLVAGDICIDVIGVPKKRPGNPGEREENWRLTGEIRTHYVRGGALLFADMIRGAVGFPNLVSGPILPTPKSLSPGKKNRPLDDSLFQRLTDDEVIHSVISADFFRKTAGATESGSFTPPGLFGPVTSTGGSQKNARPRLFSFGPPGLFVLSGWISALKGRPIS